MAEKKEYRVRPGQRHAHRGRTLNAGETLHLSAAEAERLADKFEPVEEPAPAEQLPATTGEGVADGVRDNVEPGPAGHEEPTPSNGRRRGR